jgi:hypothetical protein
MQDHVHFRRPRHLHRSAERPNLAKGFRGFTTAEEAGAVTRRKRDRSSRKNNSVQLRRAITSRWRPLNSQTQVSQALLAQRRFSRVRVAGS